MDQKIEFNNFIDIDVNLELDLVQTTSTPRKPQSNGREYYAESNHYSLQPGCYWKKKLPVQE